MKQQVVTHRYHGKIFQDGSRRVSAATLKKEARERETLERNQALVDTVIAGYQEETGKFWVGIVTKAFKSGGLEVVTRKGNTIKTAGGESTTFEKWDAAINDPENGITPQQIIA